MVSAFTNLIIDDEYAGLRLDTVLADAGCFVSRSASAKALDGGLVRVNGRTVGKNYRPAQGDLVEVLPAPEASKRPDGSDIPLDIRYEDDHLIVLSKQAGLVCHPDESYDGATLVEALIAHCGEENLSHLPGQEGRPGIVHRLDKCTSGLMVAAKSDEAARVLMAGFKEHSIDRRYLALVHGNVKTDNGRIDAPLARSLYDRKKMSVRECPSSRDAVTTFQTLARVSSLQEDTPYSLITCSLHTGRTHQIRVHLEFAKHPLVGDTVYNSGAPKTARSNLYLERPFLHSYYLSLNHPVTGESLLFYDYFPQDLSTALSQTTFETGLLTPAGITLWGTPEFFPGEG